MGKDYVFDDMALDPRFADDVVASGEGVDAGKDSESVDYENVETFDADSETEASISETVSDPLALNDLAKTRVRLEELSDTEGHVEFFEPDILVSGRRHHIYAAAESGKTWIALYLATRAVKREQTVVYWDAENFALDIKDRLTALQMSDDEMGRFYYFPGQELNGSSTILSQYREVLNNIQPDLMVFDSWARFLTACDMDESNNRDVTRWCIDHLSTSGKAGPTVIVLDHMPHEARRARGASRKNEEMDVSWELKTVKKFSRNGIGSLRLKRNKDRLGCLPQQLDFAIGGTPEGFVIERCAAASNLEPKVPSYGSGPTGKTREILHLINSHDGIIWAELELEFAKSTLSNGIRSLKAERLINDDEGVYRVTPEGISAIDAGDSKN